jgi:hypothetical protein
MTTALKIMRNKNTKRKFYYWPLLVIRALFFPLAKIPFVIIIIVLGAYALCVNDQGQDLMAAFTAKSIFGKDNLYLLLFILFLICWAISIWNVARILLTASNIKKLVEDEISEERLKEANIYEPVTKKEWIVGSIDPNYKYAMEKMIEWAPRLLALAPYIIFIIAYNKQLQAFKNAHQGAIYLVIIAALLHLAYMIYRKRLSVILLGNKENKDQKNRKKAYVIEGEKNVTKAIEKAGVKINTRLTVVMALIMLGYAILAAYRVPDHEGMPGLIVLTGFTIYTLTGFLLNMAIYNLRVPLFTIIVLLAILISLSRNNNHTIQTLGSGADTAMLNKRNLVTDSNYADRWIRKKITSGVLDMTKPKETVFIIAAEGGGIRNCYWTYRVLRELEEMKPGFLDRTFAASGVSGGSIGIGFYYNFKYYCDSLIRRGKDTTGFAKKLDMICSSDYLSRVTFGFMFPDLLQRFIPATIDSWDRSKLLANSFDDAFSAQLETKKEKYLSNNYLSMWQDTNFAYKYPALLFNTIFNEDGIKAIYSPFRLSDTYYPGAMDLLFETRRRPVPMKEAMVSSARFPVLTAPGLIWSDSISKKTGDTIPYKLGHISDGGGYENTGIETALQTAMLLRSSIDSLHKEGYKTKIEIRIIYIGTGKNSIDIKNKIPADIKEHGKAFGRSYELAWLSGSLKTVFGWINSSYNISTRLNRDLSVLQFGLEIKQDEEDKHSLPLGWFLSDSSRNRLFKQSNYETASEHYRKNIDSFIKM